VFHGEVEQCRYGNRLLAGKSLADQPYPTSSVTLMREHGVPSMPVHDSLIVPYSKMKLAQEVLSKRFQIETGMLPRLDLNDPSDF
jgi:hypothetical protein